jgi:CDGSH-type Zn-finger protein
MEKSNQVDVEMGSKEAPASFYIKITKDGPYLLFGKYPMNQQIITMNEDGENWTYKEGRSFDTNNEPCALCRCGTSAHKPFCDGSHTHAKWDPAETASREQLLVGADEYEGPVLLMADNEAYCAFARFCDAKGRVWNIVERAQTPEDIELAEREVAHCPSGRLIIWDKKEKKIVEPKFDASIGIIEDPGIRVSGPIWVRGGIRIESADGTSYEIRNRVTLCRCGASSNKPFCDGTHANFKWDKTPELGNDGKEW